MDKKKHFIVKPIGKTNNLPSQTRNETKKKKKSGNVNRVIFDQRRKR